jgi:membrane protein
LKIAIATHVQRARQFLRDELWDSQPEPRTAAARALAVLQFGVMIGQGFVKDHLLLRASALTYFTVLSIVPMLAIMISIAHAVGVTGNFAEAVVDRIAAGSPEAQEQILAFVKDANLGALGTLGAAMLFLTTVLGISNIERSFNEIWGVEQVRTWARRLPDYLTVLVVAPMLAGVALSLATTLKSQVLVQRLLDIPLFTTLYAYGLTQVPTVVLSLAFAFLIWFLPNTKVRPLSALLGGLVAGFLVMAAQSAYLGMSIGVARANALYGGFAQVPLLFIWIYFFWAIVLFGAEVAFAYQNLDLYRREVRGRKAGPAEREAIGLCIALEVACAFRDARKPWDADALADALKVPVRTVRDVLRHLEAAGIVAERGGPDREDDFQLGRPAETILVTDVIACLRGGREPLRGDDAVIRPVEALLAALDEGEGKGAAGQTLADLLSEVPRNRSPGAAAFPPAEARADPFGAQG